MSDTAPVLNEGQMQTFGQRLYSLFTTHRTDRKAAEEKWLKNMRQFRGIYDPEVVIPADRSKAYPKLTRKVVIGTMARLMQMLWPQTEKNYSVKNSPMPSLKTEQLQEVLDDLVAKTAAAQQIDPAAVELKDEEIEKAIVDYARHKATRMQLKIDDDLQEMDIITLARRVVFSAVLYNIGMLVGPFNTEVKERKWVKNPSTGKYEAKEITKFKPLFESWSIWDHYPDLTAKTLGKQSGAFDRHCMIRSQVEELADRPDFMGERVREWLTKNLSGNYTPEWWESVIKGEKKSDKQTVQNEAGRKYEVLSYWGEVTGHELRACGVEIKDSELSKTFRANVWQIGSTVIKCKIAPLGMDIKQHHYFVFEEDDLSILGNGQCDTMRDSQISLCEITRAGQDNMSVIGPMVEVNDDLLAPGQNTSISKHKTWHREGTGANATYPAVRDISVDSHLSDLLAWRAALLDFANQESGLPPPSMGDVSQGGSEALRTQGNASMFLGAAALPVRDTVRNYDSFTISYITALVKWNERFDPNPSRDCDHNIIARGSTSLIAKEVLGASLDMVRATLTPDEIPHIKTRKLLTMRLQARDVPTDELLEDEDKAEATIQRNAETQQRIQALQEAEVEAKVRGVLSKAVRDIAAARKDDASISNDAAQLLLDALEQGDANRIKEKQVDKPGAASGNK